MSQQQQSYTLSLTLPQTADELLAGSMVLLEAKLQELSGQSIQMKTSHAEDMLTAYRDGPAGLYLLDGAQMAALDDRIAFVQMPMLTPNRESLFALLNSEDGPVRGSDITRQRLGGEIVGVYYGGTTIMLTRGKFYDDVGFFNSIGVLSSIGQKGFAGIGGELLISGSQQEILQALADELVKFCELQSGWELTPELLTVVKSIEPTYHRSKSWWLVLKNPNAELESLLTQQISEAFAYTLEYQDEQRRELDTAFVESLMEAGLPVNEEAAYTATRLVARKYYRDNWKQLGIPQDIWTQLTKIL